jgi:hypothetical protein
MRNYFLVRADRLIGLLSHKRAAILINHITTRFDLRLIVKANAQTHYIRLRCRMAKQHTLLPFFVMRLRIGATEVAWPMRKLITFVCIEERGNLSSDKLLGRSSVSKAKPCGMSPRGR